MSPLALVLDAMVLLHMRDPAEFSAMPDHLQELWIGHARNHFTGAYTHVPKGRRGAGGSNSAAIEQAAIERAG